MLETQSSSRSHNLMWILTRIPNYLYRQFQKRLRQGIQARGNSFQSWIYSAIVHTLLILAMALWTFLAAPKIPPFLLTVNNVPNGTDPEVLQSIQIDHTAPSLQTETVAEELLDTPVTEIEVSTIAESEEKVEANAQQSSPSNQLSGVGLMLGTGQLGGKRLEGRHLRHRQQLLLEYGGTAESELSVRQGLEWLIFHQNKKGGWNFNHSLGQTKKQCLNPGTIPSTTGATSMALLPLLGAGQTHLEGEFQHATQRGLYYLMGRSVATAQGADLQEGTMYAQGLSTMALSEAYAMTQDKELRIFAQSALDFVIASQDPKGGGWRYIPGQPGDTSMLGWQFMAVKSGELGYLKIPYSTRPLVSKFLDSVEDEYGAKYGYQVPEKQTQATTAIGLLCRMYLGCPRETPSLRAGIEYLSKWGPAKNDMYYNYYATLAMHQYGGDLWKQWNEEMREFLIRTQTKTGPEAGSWYFPGGHGSSGGRLYNTSMAIMTLEVYYRYLPIYRTKPLSDEF